MKNCEYYSNNKKQFNDSIIQSKLYKNTTIVSNHNESSPNSMNNSSNSHFNSKKNIKNKYNPSCYYLLNLKNNENINNHYQENELDNKNLNIKINELKLNNDKILYDPLILKKNKITINGPIFRKLLKYNKNIKQIN